VIVDIRQTQKDINLTEGKLERTYAEVDYKVFEVGIKFIQIKNNL
jgi:hypothetical protein